MRNLSFAYYVLRCRANPSLAQKSAFEMYRNYQRAQMRTRWFSKWLFNKFFKLNHFVHLW